MSIRTHFAFRIDMWTDDGENIVEHVASAADLEVAMATYHVARKRWPKAAITLRQGERVIEDSRRMRLADKWPTRPARQAVAALMTIKKTPGAQFEISIDGKPCSYRDRKDIAIALVLVDHSLRPPERGHSHERESAAA